MSTLTVIERGSLLVIDSRLIADYLEVAHKNVLGTLDKYKQRIESAFGIIAFETRKSERGRAERFAWLTEEQSTFLMTLSRNTDKVVSCKLELVKVFSRAKEIINLVIPSQAQEIERLKLELQLAQTQERLLLTTQAIATMHGSQMVALILGKPEAIVTRTEKVETLVTVDNHGNAIAKYNGIGITYLAKRYGFGSNTKACRHWLESIGVSESQWLTEPSLVKAQKLPREIIPWLDRQYASRQGTRQSLLGE
jgi:phage regulator Rha-like protein